MSKVSSNTRRVFVHGALIRVEPANPNPRPYAGGGRRGAQQGHTQRSARRMEYDLQTAKPPVLVVWLTFPQLQGPLKVRAHVKGFLGRLERKMGSPIAAVAKMEIQGRLSTEVGVAIWTSDEASLRAVDFKAIWCKRIKVDGRVRVEEVRDWSKLASYLSKKIVVNASTVTVGHKTVSIDLSKGDKTDQFSPTSGLQTSGPMAILGVFNEWISYTGRYWWKHNAKGIPRQERVVMNVPSGTVDKIRALANNRRREHGIGAQDGFTVRGTEAAEALKVLEKSQLPSTDRSTAPLSGLTRDVAPVGHTDTRSNPPLPAGPPVAPSAKGATGDGFHAHHHRMPKVQDGKDSTTSV